MVGLSKNLNELTGKEWLQHSFSIWRDIKKTEEEKKLKHPAMFPVDLASRLIGIFSKEGDVVLDPFLGSGSTMLAAFLKKRKCIGMELSEEYVTLAKNRLRQILPLYSEGHIQPEIHHADARELDELLKNNSIDLCVTSPPYWDILNQKRTADRKEIVNYGDSEKDLGNIDDYEEFLRNLKDVFSKMFDKIKKNGYCVVVVMDLRKKNKFFPLHSDVAKLMEEIGFEFDDIIIWDRQHEYNNMRPLGYPYVFRVNKVHEFILIFKKVDL